MALKLSDHLPYVWTNTTSTTASVAPITNTTAHHTSRLSFPENSVDGGTSNAIALAAAAPPPPAAAAVATATATTTNSVLHAFAPVHPVVQLSLPLQLPRPLPLPLPLPQSMRQAIPAIPVPSPLPFEFPFPAQLEVGDALVDALTSIIEIHTARSRASPAPVKLPNWAHPTSVFFSVKIPEISVRSYLFRLCKFANCSPAAFVIALIYMDRLAVASPNLHVSDYNVHRLLVTAVCVGAKFLDDRCYSNAHYTRVGGIPSVKEMNRLETHLIRLLNFHLFVSTDQYLDKQQYVLSQLTVSPRQISDGYYIVPSEMSAASSPSMNAGMAMAFSASDVLSVHRDVSPVSVQEFSFKQSEPLGQTSYPLMSGHTTKHTERASQPAFIVAGRHHTGPAQLSILVEVSPVSLKESTKRQQEQDYVLEGIEEGRQPRAIVSLKHPRDMITMQHPSHLMYASNAPSGTQTMGRHNQLQLLESNPSEQHVHVNGYRQSEPMATLFRPSSGSMQNSLLRPAQVQNISRKRPLSGPNNMNAVYR